MKQFTFQKMSMQFFLILEIKNKEIKLLGGTGKTHNWDLSKTIVESVSVPVYLAGGLDTHNIVEAVEKVNPYSIDLCSGVRNQ